MLRESEVIRLVQTILGRDRDGWGGIGDDGALLREGDGRVIATDAMVEDVHFRRDWSAPEDVGWKLAVANIRDLHAMNADPRAALLTLAASRDVSKEWLTRFLHGIAEARDRYAPELDVVGGDTTTSPGPFMASMTLVGAQRGPLWSRSGLEPGCRLWMDGPSGLSAAGLVALQSGWASSGALQKAVEAHLRPTPSPLGKTTGVLACMDLSDGLSSAAHTMAQASGVRVLLRESALPEDVQQFAGVLGEEVTRHALLHGGEDHALLAGARTCPGEGWRAVGEVMLGEVGVWIETRAGDVVRLDVGAWEHFT